MVTGGGTTTVIEQASWAVVPALDTCNTKDDVPAGAKAVPAITFPLRLSPEGREPLTIEKKKLPSPPLADKTWL